MSAFDVSIVIPSFNHGHLLERAVYSALRAGAGEVVIVDDASTDRTRFIGEGLRHAPEILYLRNPFHSGVVYSRNRAIYAANYELILPLDADDTLLNLEPLMSAWQEGTWVYGAWQEDGRVILPPPQGVLGRKELGWVSMLFHKDDWQRVGGYDVELSIGNEIWGFQRALVNAGVLPTRIEDVIFERTVGGAGTQRALAWAHVITALVNEKYPIAEGMR